MVSPPNCESWASGDDYVGGFVGWSAGSHGSGIITTSYSTATVSGNENVGGLVGIVTGWSGSINNCYSTGTVNGSSEVGGLVGLNNDHSSITDSYSTGTVTGNENVGGLVGAGSGSVVHSIWDIDTSGQTTSAGGTGKTTSEMQDPKTFMAIGWDFVGQPDGPHDIWFEPEGGGYPVLWWQFPPDFGLPGFAGGKGEPNDPYRISTAEELNSIGDNPRLMESHFMLTDDLDLTDFHFYPIGSSDFPYRGVFDGNAHVISHLMIEGKNYLGLFGFLGDGAEVKDLGVVDVNITSSDDYVGGPEGSSIGGLAGSSNGSINNCYSTGTVSGNWYVGGLVGSNEGSITTSYSTGSVGGYRYVGGLVGSNHSSITASYSTGSVSGEGNYVGGLVGDNWSTGTATQCFWDVETSGQTTSEGGTGLTTAEMQTDSTFLEVSWDFIDETENGTEDIWSICEGMNYPRFVWQIPAGDFVCPDGITIEDIVFFIEHWRDDNCDLSNDYCEGTDLDFSGTVDEADLEILIDNWLAVGND